VVASAAPRRHGPVLPRQSAVASHVPAPPPPLPAAAPTLTVDVKLSTKWTAGSRFRTFTVKSGRSAPTTAVAAFEHFCDRIIRGDPVGVPLIENLGATARASIEKLKDSARQSWANEVLQCVQSYSELVEAGRRNVLLGVEAMIQSGYLRVDAVCPKLQVGGADLDVQFGVVKFRMDQFSAHIRQLFACLRPGTAGVLAPVFDTTIGCSSLPEMMKACGVPLSTLEHLDNHHIDHALDEWLTDAGNASRRLKRSVTTFLVRNPIFKLDKAMAVSVVSGGEERRAFIASLPSAATRRLVIELFGLYDCGEANSGDDDVKGGGDGASLSGCARLGERTTRSDDDGDSDVDEDASEDDGGGGGRHRGTSVDSDYQAMGSKANLCTRIVSGILLRDLINRHSNGGSALAVVPVTRGHGFRFTPMDTGWCRRLHASFENTMLSRLASIVGVEEGTQPFDLLRQRAFHVFPVSSCKGVLWVRVLRCVTSSR
jgi:hypothetical protein